MGPYQTSSPIKWSLEPIDIPLTLLWGESIESVTALDLISEDLDSVPGFSDAFLHGKVS